MGAVVASFRTSACRRTHVWFCAWRSLRTFSLAAKAAISSLPKRTPTTSIGAIEELDEVTSDLPSKADEIRTLHALGLKHRKIAEYLGVLPQYVGTIIREYPRGRKRAAANRPPTASELAAASTPCLGFLNAMTSLQKQRRSSWTLLRRKSSCFPAYTSTEPDHEITQR